jgi:carbon-monoxide dehydrogenase large subunit
VPHNYPKGVEPGLEETSFFDPPNFTYPAGTYVCELEVDPSTGTVEIQRSSRSTTSATSSTR